MSSLQDTIAAFASLNAGLKDVAVNSAVNDGIQQVNQIKQQQLGQEDKLKAMTDFSQNFAMRLTQAGAGPGEVQQLADRFGVSNSAQFQAQENEKLQKNTETFQASESAKNRENEREHAARAYGSPLQNRGNQKQRKRGLTLYGANEGF
jgi:hypothetical protein